MPLCWHLQLGQELCHHAAQRHHILLTGVRRFSKSHKHRKCKQSAQKTYTVTIMGVIGEKFLPLHPARHHRVPLPQISQPLLM